MIAVVGAGRVGTSTALQIAMRELGDITLVDIIEGLPQGEALDLNHACATLKLDVDVRGSNDYRDIAGSEIVVITAGFIRKADMTRLDLLHKNSQIIKSIAKELREYTPKAKVIVVTNPLDVMTYVCWKTSGFEASRVMGFSGLLDTGRFNYLLRKALGISYRSINSMVVGEHGDSMVLLPRFSYAGAASIQSLLGDGVLSKIEETRKAGAEIIRLKGWSAHHAPGAGVALMVEAIAKDSKTVTPVSAYLDGQYGFKDIYTVVPCILGSAGVEKVIELPLNSEEKNQFERSVAVLRQALAQVNWQA